MTRRYAKMMVSLHGVATGLQQPIHAAMRSGWAVGERLCQRASVVKIGMTRMQQRRRVTGKLRAVAYRMCLEQTMWPHGVAAKDQHGQFYIPSQKVFPCDRTLGSVCQPTSQPDAPGLALSPHGSNPWTCFNGSVRRINFLRFWR